MSATSSALNPFIERTRSSLDHVADIDTGALEAALRCVIDRSDIAGWLLCLIDEQETLAAVAAASCWHSNGFAKIVLYRAERFSVQLHVWSVGRPLPTTPEPHSHRWDFASTVLTGGLDIRECEEVESGISEHYIRCSYDGEHVRPGFTAMLRETRTYSVDQGDYYFARFSIVHKVSPHAGNTASTLLLQGPHRRASTEVYRVPGNPGLPPAQEISSDEVRELLIEVAGKVRN